MRLMTKIMIGVILVIIIANMTVFYFIGRRYDHLLMERLAESARSFYKQIVVTRAWVAHYDGVFMKYHPGMEINKYLKTPIVVTTEGDTLVKRNPALVTRELSTLGEHMGGFRFHLTSLQPINPDNAPNDFEREALLALHKRDDRVLSTYGEFTKLEQNGKNSYFRYFAPLYTEESCLSCHSDQGYKVGDVRGGISIIVPAQKVVEAKKRNFVLMVLGGLGASAAIVLLILYFLRRTVILPLRELEMATEKIAEGNYVTEISVHSSDEIGDLRKAFMRMQQAIQDSLNRQIITEKMVALGQLSAGIAHEIRNPLFAIRNNLDYLKRHYAGDTDRAEVYQEMEDGVNRISKTVQAILDYSKPHPPEFSRHHIREALDRCMALMGKQLRKENIDIKIDIKPDLPPIDMDIHRMEQVMINLLTNARKALNGNGRRNEISIAVRRKENRICVEVKDSGIGIKSTDLNRIFDPFYTRSAEGTGLGLTIVKRIVQQHNGEIRVKSREGQGTVFVIELPIKQDEVAC